MPDATPPAPVAPEESPQTQESEDRKAFAEIAAKYRAKEEKAGAVKAPSQQPPKPDAQETISEEAPALPPTTPKTNEGEERKPATPKKEEKPEVAADALKKAKDYLRLKAKARDSALDSMSSQEVADWAADVREREVGIDRSLQERAHYAKELEQLKSKATPVAGEGEPQPEPAPAPDRKAATDKLAESLSLTKEDREALEEFATSLTAPLEARLVETQETVRSRELREAATTTERVRAELGKRFPKLAEDETWKEVFETARKNEDGSQFGGTAEARFDEYAPRLFESAARFHGVEEVDPQAEAEAQQEAEAERATRLNSAPTTDSRPTPVTPRSKQAEDWAVFQKVSKKRRGSAVG